MNSTYVVFHPSDALVGEFRRIYHGGLLNRLQHLCSRSLLSHEEAREELAGRTHEALLARFWPWTGDIANPIMGYPLGEDISVAWGGHEEEKKLLTTLNWSLSGLFHSKEITEEHAGIARRLLAELFGALATGRVLHSDGAEFSFSDGHFIARVTPDYRWEFVPDETGWVKEG